LDVPPAINTNNIFIQGTHRPEVPMMLLQRLGHAIVAREHCLQVSYEGFAQEKSIIGFEVEDSQLDALAREHLAGEVMRAGIQGAALPSRPRWCHT